MGMDRRLLDWLGFRGGILVLGIGGGSDAVSAIPVILLLRSLGMRIAVGNIHRAGDAASTMVLAEKRWGDWACEFNVAPNVDRFARPTEVIVSKELGIQGVSVFANGGARGLRSSILEFMQSEGCSRVFLIDGGTDALAGFDSNVTTVVTDALGLATAVMLSESTEVVPLGVIGACADGEMEVDLFLKRLGQANLEGGLLGLLPFPKDGVDLFELVLRKVRDSYPGFVADTVLRAARGTLESFTNLYGSTVHVAPWQAITFVIDARWAARRNPFAEAVLDTSSYEDARDRIVELLRQADPSRKDWESRVVD
jgi:hypothetical protein